MAPDGEEGVEVVAIPSLVADALAASSERPVILGIDGRSSSGKSTLAQRIQGLDQAYSVVHTDDVAWYHSRFGWADLLIDHILIPAREGAGVTFSPPAWQTHGRRGSIDVPADRGLLVVEGVGTGRRSIAPHLDWLVWVETSDEITDARSAARIGQPGGPQSGQHLQDWLAEERPLLAEERPWERADVIVYGSPSVSYEPATEVVVMLRTGER